MINDIRALANATPQGLLDARGAEAGTAA